MKMLRSGMHSHQDGIVLVTCLVILLILTMLALSSVQSTSLQELITRNQRDSNLAFNAAEAAIVVAEGQINALTEISYALDASPLIYDAVTLGPLDVSSADLWTAAASICAAGDATCAIQGVNSQPRYVIEHIGTVVSDEDRLNLDNIGQNPNICCTQMFRVTARGTGGTDAAVVMLQSTFGKRF